MTPYQENRLIVYQARIEKLKKETAYFEENWLRYFILGIIFSFQGHFIQENNF